MASILQLPHEILICIYELLENPKNFSMSCRSLKVISEDPAVISTWLLYNPKNRIRHCPKLIFEIPVLERLVILSELLPFFKVAHMEYITEKVAGAYKFDTILPLYPRRTPSPIVGVCKI